MNDHGQPQDRDLDPPPLEGPSDALRQRIRAAVEADLRPVRSLSLRTRGMLTVLAFVTVGVVVVHSFGVSLDLALVRPAPALAGVMIIAAVAALVIGGFAPGLQQRFGRATKATLAVLLLAVWLSHVVSASVPAGPGHTFGAGLHGCLWRAVLAGTVAAAAMFWVWRKADPWAPRQTGALLGAAGGCVSSAAVGLVCPAAPVDHMVVGHALAIPLLALLGVLAARRILAP